MNIFQILDTVRTDLHNRYGHELDEAEIDGIFDRVVANNMSTATVPDFVPVFVEREVSTEIENIVLDNPLRTVAKRAVIQFVNRDNGTMAEVAAAMLRARAGEQVRVVTARTHPENATDAKLEAQARRRRLDLPEARLRSRRVLDTPDVTVYLGANEAHDMGGRRQWVWDVPVSTDGMNDDQVTTLVADLEQRVEGIVEMLTLRNEAPALTA